MVYTKVRGQRKHGPKPLTPEQLADKRQLKAMKERAAILSIAQVGHGQFRVWGGTSPHIVQPTIGGLIVCDCEGWSKARHHNCSHVMKYRLTYGDLKK